MGMQAENYQKGRGAQFNTINKFDKNYYEQLHPEAIDDWEQNIPQTSFIQNNTTTIVNKVLAQEVGMQWSVNPYQGCEHGCVYCYARNSHQYWGYSAGADFESKIMVKENAPALLRRCFDKKTWQPAPISLSGNTDCYQPAERKYKITRELLKICLEYRNPVGILTKNALVLRDVDILQELHKHKLVQVFTSITSTDEKLRLLLEPRTSAYAKRLKIIEILSGYGIPTGIMNAPIIPGINDSHMHEVLKQASHAGATWAGYTIVRLEGGVEPIFKDWLYKNFADRAEKVWHLIQSCHGGEVSDARTKTRMQGDGNVAEIIQQQFALYAKKYNLHNHSFTFNTADFRRSTEGQMRLF